jgi:hypothetical protein
MVGLKNPYRNLNSENSRDYARKPQQNGTFINSASSALKGTVPRDFLLLAFFMDQFPQSPRVYHFASQGASPVSMTPAPNGSPTPMANLPPLSTTPAANFAVSFASVVDTVGKFATCVNDTSGK